jgi:hypothetical protein
MAAKQPEQRFVDQGARLKRVVRALVAHHPPRDPSHFAVDGDNEPSSGLGVAGSDLVKQDSEIVLFLNCHRDRSVFPEMNTEVFMADFRISTGSGASNFSAPFARSQPVRRPVGSMGNRSRFRGLARK